MTTKKNTPTTAKGSTPKKRDPLAPFRRQSQTILNLYFGRETPKFVKDLIASWMTRLESETQVFYNHLDIARVALPLMLQEAARMGLEPFDPRSVVCLEAYSESGDVNDTREHYQHEPTERELLQTELERDAEAIARLLNSPHVPKGIKNTLGEIYGCEVASYLEHPDVIRAQWPLTALRFIEEKKGGE